MGRSTRSLPLPLLERRKRGKLVPHSQVDHLTPDLTSRDEEDIDESWSFPGKIEDALEVVKDWDPTCAAIISKTPPDACIDFKLVYRDPYPTWVSKGGHTALLGDAAHPFLPTSVSDAVEMAEI